MEGGFKKFLNIAGIAALSVGAGKASAQQEKVLTKGSTKIEQPVRTAPTKNHQVVEEEVFTYPKVPRSQEEEDTMRRIVSVPDTATAFADTIQEAPLTPIAIELDRLRAERIEELTKNIDRIKLTILQNKNKSLFEQDYRKSFEPVIIDLQPFLKNCAEIKSTINSFSNEEVQLLVAYIIEKNKLKKAIIWDGSIVKNQEPATFSKKNELEQKLENNEKLDLFYLTTLTDFVSNHEDEVVVGLSRSEEQSPKTTFANVIDEIVKKQKELSAPIVQDEKDIQAEIDTAWEGRDSLEYWQLELKLAQENLNNIALNLDEKTVYNFIDSDRNWLEEKISSDGYLKKLLGEGLSAKEARKEQQKRLNRLFQTPFYISTTPLNQGDEHSEVSYAGGMLAKMNAEQIAIEKKVAGHEWEHVATDGILGMTEVAIKLYENALISEKELENIKNTPIGKIIFSDKDDSAYLRNPTEMDARKKTLEADMEDLGVKGMFEPMTNAHYQKLWELLKAGKLSRQSMQLIMITTGKGLIEVMNKVASVDKPKKNEDTA